MADVVTSSHIDSAKKFPEIETGRLILRQFSENDIPDFVRIYGDEDGMLYMGKGAKTPQESAQSVRWKMKHWVDRGYGLWCVEEKKSGSVVGHCGVAWLEWMNDIEIAYLISRDHWGKGYATEAVTAAIAYGFEVVHAPQIIAIIRPDNVQSERVAEKAGLKYFKDTTNGGFPFRCFKIDGKSFNGNRKSYKTRVVSS